MIEVIKDNNKSNKKGHKVFRGILCLLVLCVLNGLYSDYLLAQQSQQKAEIKPQVPTADRYQKNKVFLEYADELIADEKLTPEYQVLRGNVKFRKEGMFMYCDSAYFYDKKNSIDAFGNIKMEHWQD